VLVKNLSIITEDQADELKNIVKAHRDGESGFGFNS